MANFPNFPESGKNAAVFISSSDGQTLNKAAMTLQGTYLHRGKSQADKVYLLGAGKTLLNMRPEKAPKIIIDGVIDGLEIEPAATDGKVNVTAGVAEVGGELISIPAKDDLSLTLADTKKAWNAIYIDTDDGNSIKTAGGTEDDTLVDAWGTDAGEKPLIPVTGILIGCVKAGSAAAPVVQDDIDYAEREFGAVDYELLPNIGGCMVQNPLAKIHAGKIGRPVFFTGYYLDGVMAKIGTAKEWSLDAASNDNSDETFAGAYSQTSISGFSVTFTQLAADRKVIDAVFKREGHCGLRVQFAGGFAWQSVATVVPSVKVAVGSYNTINVTASLGDFPEEHQG